jgi:ectoine hydroxylase-related dioxygenase (phytanoyl-CoA dioxygenase family)
MASTELAPHPWSQAFTWRPPSSTPRYLSVAAVRQFDELGYFVLEDAFRPDEIAAVVAEIDAVEARVEQFLRGLEDQRMMIAEAGAITFSVHLVSQSPLLRSFATHALLADLCADLIGPDVNLYWDQAVYKKPEKPRRFPWHQDNGYTFVEPQQYLTCWVALTDATEDNGCPWVAPFLHKLGTLRHTYVEPLGWECFSQPPQAVMAPARAGSIVVFSSLTPHLTGPNVTAAVRKAYILQYAPAGARMLLGDPYAGPPNGERSCDEPTRQFAVLREGQPVALGARTS